MKLYTFLDDNEEIIEQVRANNHDEAIQKANSWEKEDEVVVDSNTDFYSENIEE